MNTFSPETMANKLTALKEALATNITIDVVKDAAKTSIIYASEIDNRRDASYSEIAPLNKVRRAAENVIGKYLDRMLFSQMTGTDDLDPYVIELAQSILDLDYSQLLKRLHDLRVIMDSFLDGKPYIDDHKGAGERSFSNVRGIVLFNGRWCPVHSGYCSTNPLYVSKRDGLIHLDSWAIGPTIQPGSLENGFTSSYGYDATVVARN